MTPSEKSESPTPSIEPLGALPPESPPHPERRRSLLARLATFSLGRTQEAGAGAAAERAYPGSMASDEALGLRPHDPSLTRSEGADASILEDIDAILSRFDDGIARERKSLDELLQRIRRPAA